ncbi:MAG: hypothetical protein ACOCVM_04805 [Desulfovibrionaceae bacterium]
MTGPGQGALLRAVLMAACLAALAGCSWLQDIAAPVEKLFEEPPPQQAVRVLLLPDDADPESLPRAGEPYRRMYAAAWKAMKAHGLVLGGERDLPHNLLVPGREAPREQAILEAARVRVWDYVALVSYFPVLKFPHEIVEVQAEGQIRILPVQWKGPAIPVHFTSIVSRTVGPHPDKYDILDAVAEMSPSIGKDVGDELAGRVGKLAELHPPRRGANATGLAYEGKLPDAWAKVRSFRPHARFAPVISQPVRDRMRKNLGVDRLQPGSAAREKDPKGPAAKSPSGAEKSGDAAKGSGSQGAAGSADPKAVDDAEKLKDVPTDEMDHRDS